jgi:hypothetical protein
MAVILTTVWMDVTKPIDCQVGAACRVCLLIPLLTSSDPKLIVVFELVSNLSNALRSYMGTLISYHLCLTSLL